MRHIHRTNHNHLSHRSSGPSVSAIVLCHNHEKFILECLESILTFRDVITEIVVLDDSSDDETEKIVRDVSRKNAKIRILKNRSRTADIAHNTQRLIEEATGTYILFMSGDDMLGPDYAISRIIGRLETDDRLALVIPRMAFLMQQNHMRAPRVYDGEFLKSLRSTDPSCLCNDHLYRRVSRLFLQGAVIRKQIIEEMGGFASGTSSDDYAFFMRLFTHLAQTDKTFYFEEESTWLYRIHGSNIHRESMRQFCSILEVVSRFVPEEHWGTFAWDRVVFDQIDELETALRTARTTLGKAHARRLVWTVSLATILQAIKRRDSRFLRRVASSASLPARLRLLAAVSAPACALTCSPHSPR